METVECQGFQLSRYAAELAEREGVDVGLIKRMLDMSPRERIEQSQKAADFVSHLREAGKRMRQESDFPVLLKRLDEFGVEHILVGGMAAVFHGSEITNIDCDLVVGFSQKNLVRIALALAPVSPTFRDETPLRKFDEAAAKDIRSEMIYLNTAAGFLDCHKEIIGIGAYAECNRRSMEVDLGGFSIRVLNREALIEAKKAMGRPKDLLTVAQLEIGAELERT